MKVDSILNQVTESYIKYGDYVNNFRAHPSVFDGLKPSYRRVIYASYKLGRTMKKTALIVGETMRYHPHGNASIEPIVSNLVRYGIMEGQGDHGRKFINGVVLPPSAPRYTGARLSPHIYDMLDTLLPSTPHIESELGEDKEPLYIPTPIPMSMTFDLSIGIGIGIANRLPTFTYRSMYNAFKKDDPNYLRYTGVDVKGDLKRIWNRGYGMLTYSMNVERDGSTVMIKGNPLFIPNIKPLNEMARQGRITIENYTSTKDILIIKKVPRVHEDMDRIHKVCKDTFSYKKTFMIAVTDSKKAYRIGLRDWIAKCHHTYMAILDKVISAKLSHYEERRDILSKFPDVVNVLIQDRNIKEDDLVTKSGVSRPIVKEVLSKPISYLSNATYNRELTSIEEKYKEYQNIDKQSILESHII